MKKKHSVNMAKEVMDAIIRWKKLDSRSAVFTSQFYEFAKFIGYPTEPDSVFIVDISKPEVVKIINAINGPYGDAILKVLELKHGRSKQAQEEGLGTP